MREYESIFVLDPDVSDAQVEAEVEKIREFVITKKGEVTEVQKWGRRKLAYEIGKNREGNYTLIRFQSDSALPQELERRYRLNENMIRFLTVLYEKPSVPEVPAGEERPGDDDDGDEDV
jgi:small subunit ribosomal protein S6